MVTVRNNHPVLSWDDLISAINPAAPSSAERIRSALRVIAQLLDAGDLTETEAEALTKMILNAGINNEVSAIVSSYFAPKKQILEYDGLRRVFASM